MLTQLVISSITSWLPATPMSAAPKCFVAEAPLLRCGASLLCSDAIDGNFRAKKNASLSGRLGRGRKGWRRETLARIIAQTKVVSNGAAYKQQHLMSATSC